MKNEMNETNSFINKRHSNSKIGCSSLLVITGVALLGFNLGWFPAAYKAIFLSWQMLLIALGVLSLLKKQITWGLFLLLIGGFFLLPTIGKVFPDFLGGIPTNIMAYWPIILIIAGVLALLQKPFRIGRRGSHKKSMLTNNKDFIDKDIMFGSAEVTVFSDDFKGGDINVGFGDIKIDLRKVTDLNLANETEVNVMFGSAVIYVPEQWRVELKSKTFLGSIEDKRLAVVQSDENNSKTIFLICSVMFGDINIM